MQRRLALILAGVVAAAAFLGTEDASARSQRWLVDFEVKALDRILIQRALGADRPAWYCVFSLTNNTGMDRDLALSLFVETDAERGAPGRRRRERWQAVVDPSVQRSVEARLGLERPLLDAVQVQGRLRVSERKEAIAVFGPVSGESDEVTLFVAGLSSAVEEQRRGVWYQNMIRGGKEVCSVTRTPGGGYRLIPLARPIDLLEFKKLTSERKVPLVRQVGEAGGEAFYALDHPWLADAEKRPYLERMVLRRRYSRWGDERQPQLDNYKLEGEDWIIAIEPVAPPQP